MLTKLVARAYEAGNSSWSHEPIVLRHFQATRLDVYCQQNDKQKKERKQKQEQFIRDTRGLSVELPTSQVGTYIVHMHCGFYPSTPLVYRLPRLRQAEGKRFCLQRYWTQRNKCEILQLLEVGA